MDNDLLGVDLSFDGSFDDDGIFADDLSDTYFNAEGSKEPLDFEESLESDFSLEDDKIVEDADEGVSLEFIDFREKINQQAWEEVEFPALFIEGLMTEEEFRFFRGRSSEDKNSLPLYCVVEGTPVKVCQLEVSLQSFLNFKIIGGYTIRLYKDATTSTVMQLDKPEALVKFIKL